MKLNNILRYRLTPWQNIIQFSPVRSGSTLVYNLLRECFPGKVIDKSHTYSKHYLHLPIVATVRNPLDCIASLLLVEQSKLDETNLRWAVNELTRLGGADFARLATHRRCLYLRYEEFFENYDLIFDAFEGFFGISIPVARRAEITSRYNLESAEAIAARQGTFAKSDKVTKIHGNHISANRGRPLYHQEFFTREQLDLLKPMCKNLLSTFGYDE